VWILEISDISTTIQLAKLMSYLRHISMVSKYGLLGSWIAESGVQFSRLFGTMALKKILNMLFPYTCGQIMMRATQIIACIYIMMFGAITIFWINQNLAMRVSVLCKAQKYTLGMIFSAQIESKAFGEIFVVNQAFNVVIIIKI
jgi:hypothetical protein